MSAKIKAYFFETPKSELYDRFSQKNKPSETSFRTLFDSVTFKLEVKDTASLTQQGLVKLVSDRDAETRTSSDTGSMVQVVQPHQLPMLIVNTEEVAVSTSESFNGIMVTGVEKESEDLKRLSYKISLDCATLDPISPISDEDYVVAIIGGTTCKILVSSLSSTGGLWRRDVLDIGGPGIGEANTLRPMTNNDNIENGTGKVYTGGLVLGSDESVKYIILRNAENDGVELRIVGGSSNNTGKADGGSVRLLGGSSVHGGNGGDIILNYDGLHTVGAVGINGEIDETYVYRCKIDSGLWVTGSVRFDIAIGGGPAPSPIDGPVVISSEGVVYSPPVKKFMDFMVGSDLDYEAIIYFDGNSYNSLSSGNVGDKYLVTDPESGLAFEDLNLRGKVNDDSFEGNGVISVARLISMTPSMIVGTDGAGKLISTGINPSVLANISGLGSPAQAQLDTIKAAAGGAGMLRTDANYTLLAASMFSTIILECTANSVNINLPALAAVPNNTILTFIKKFTAGAFAGTITLAGSDKYNLLTDLESSSVLTISGISGSYVRIQKYNNSVWHQIL